MSRVTPWLLWALFAAGAGFSTQAHCDDADALALQSASEPGPNAESPLRAALEFSAGRLDQRFNLPNRDTHRVSLDVRYAARFGDAWRLTLSDRLDDVHPVPDGQRSTTNSVREAYLAWQEAGAATTFDIGRINVRQGPAFGYNPTDFFRTGALRAITTLDPIALREMRMGTVMMRVGQLWPNASASLALAPKLDSGPHQHAASLDLGATNSQNRALLSASARLSEGISGQGSLLFKSGSSPTVGASMTALATDSLVAFAEWSSGKVPELLDVALGTTAASKQVQQAAFGMTYTLPGNTAVTVEAEYNGAGLDRAGWAAVLNGGATAYQRYLTITQTSQELGARRAWLLYASKKGLGLKQLDLTAFLRTNAIDHSHLAWIELRHHWASFDAALQVQRSSGDPGSEYGFLPYRNVVQLLGVFYF